MRYERESFEIFDYSFIHIIICFWNIFLLIKNKGDSIFILQNYFDIICLEFFNLIIRIQNKTITRKYIWMNQVMIIPTPSIIAYKIKQDNLIILKLNYYS